MGGAPYGLNTPAMSHTGLQVNNVTVLEGVGGTSGWRCLGGDHKAAGGRSHTWGRWAALKPRSRATSAGLRVTRWQLVRAGFSVLEKQVTAEGEGARLKWATWCRKLRCPYGLAVRTAHRVPGGHGATMRVLVPPHRRAPACPALSADWPGVLPCYSALCVRVPVLPTRTSLRETAESSCRGTWGPWPPGNQLLGCTERWTNYCFISLIKVQKEPQTNLPQCVRSKWCFFCFSDEMRGGWWTTQRNKDRVFKAI